MELVDSIMEIAKKVYGSIGITDYVSGTVTAIDPLEITLVNTMIPLPAEVLELTESVVEKYLIIDPHYHTINVLGHDHTYSEGTTGTALAGAYDTLTKIWTGTVYEHGIALPTELGKLTFNRGLEVGDKVILLRVLDGQKFLVLSRVFEEYGGGG